jgi:hypothetical protein
MKKIFAVALLSIISASVNADYLLTIEDENGQQTNCITSYSYSNNLESVIRHRLSTNLEYDVYSTTETLTNKIWKGKPVYRKIVEYGDLSNLANNSNSWYTYPLGINDIDEISDADIHLSGKHQHYSHFLKYSSQFRYFLNKSGFSFVFSSGFRSSFEDVNVILEYTKTTNTQSFLTTGQESTQITNYIHYVTSGSIAEQVTTITTDGKNVSLENGYSYDTISASCTSQTE